MSDFALSESRSARIVPAAPRVADMDKDLRLVLYSVWLALGMLMFKEVLNDPSIFFIGSYNVSVTDPIIVFQVWAIGSLYSRRTIRNDLLSWLCLGMGALVLLGVLRGMEDNLFEALRSIRYQGAFAFFLLMVPVLPRDETLLRKIRDAIIIFALITSVLVVLRFLIGPSLFMRAVYQDILLINDGGRPITADGALVMGVGIAMFLSRWIEKDFGRYAAIALPVFAVLCFCLLLTAQATAIIGSTLSIATVAALHPSLNRPTRIFVVVVTISLLALLVLYLSGYFGPPDLSIFPRYVQDNLKRRTGTVEFRQFIWRGLMIDFQRWNIIEQLFGLISTDKPYIFMPYADGMYWWSAIHSMYYGAIVFMGIVGLTLYIVMLLATILGGLRWVFGPKQSWTRFGGAIPLGVIMAIVVFGYSYEIRDEHAALILFAVIASRPASRPAPLTALQPKFGR